MSLRVFVDFVRRSQSPPKALVFTASALPDVHEAHIHIGRGKPLMRHRAQMEVFEKGTRPTPLFIDVAFGQIAAFLEQEGPGADIVFEPLNQKATLSIDVALALPVVGEKFNRDDLLLGCRAGTPAAADIPELGDPRAQIKIRCVANIPTAIRVWANEPRTLRRSPNGLVFQTGA